MHKKLIIRTTITLAAIALAACQKTPPTPTQTPLPPTATPPPTPTFTPEPTALPDVACDKLAFGNEQGIYLVNPDGSDLVHLADAPDEFDFDYLNIQWSPDRRWLSCKYSSLRDSGGLYVLSTDGAVHKQLARVQTWSGRHGWSPDSQYVLNVSCNTMTCGFYVIHVETGRTVCDLLITQGTISGRYQPFDCNPVELSDGLY